MAYTLVTGGARSGKSSFAESICKDEKKVCYIATNVGHDDDPEMTERVLKHQRQRPNDWQTEERFLDVGDFLKQNDWADFFLLDCSTMLTTNLFFHLLAEDARKVGKTIAQQIELLDEPKKMHYETLISEEWQKIIESAKMINKELIIVANEVGMGIVPEDSLTRWFRDVYGRINQQLSRDAENVYLVVTGIPLKIK